jgi:Mg-chelatase subunit ChlD
MKTMKTEIVMIIDRSGSMASMVKEAQRGINRFLREQKDEKGKAVLTIAQFDDKYDIVVDGVDVKTIDPENTYHLVPRAMTALLDAVGKTVTTVLERQSKDKKSAKQTICVVVTDGQENSSHEYKKAQIQDLVKKAEGRGWSFVFLGANQDAFAEGQSMGFRQNTNYTPDSASNAFLYASNLTRSYRNGESISDKIVNDIK